MKKKLLCLAMFMALVVGGLSFPTNAYAKYISVTYQAYANNAGWLSNITDLNDFAGNFGSPMTGVYINLSEGNVYYQAHIKGGGWLSEIANRSDFSGNLGQPMDAIRIRTDTGLQINYRVHVLGGGWLSFVTGYDTNNAINGYAGNMGQTIDGIQMYLTNTSPQSSTLQAPLNGQRVITSPFDAYRGVDNYHNGVDLGANIGDPVYALQSGTVIRVSYHVNLGNYVDIKYNDSLYVRCQHLNSANVTVGQNVNKYTVIGAAGNTGYSTGPHLHIEFRTTSDFRYGAKAVNDSNWNYAVANQVIQMQTSPGNVVPAPDPVVPVPDPVVPTPVNYTLTFNTNGGSAVSSVTALSGSLVTVPANPVKTNYTFGGWFKNSSLSTAWNFATDKLTGNTTLYAKWIAATPANPTNINTTQTNTTQTNIDAVPTNINTVSTDIIAAPININAVSTNYKTITISWANSDNADEYDVYRSTSSNGTYSLIATTSSSSYINSGLKTGKTYYYKVVAVLSDTGTTSVDSAVVSAKVVPGTVVKSAVKKVSSRSIKVSYKSVAGASGYEIFYSKALSGKYTKAKTTTSKSYTKTGLSKGKTYYFRVRAFRVVNDKKIYGAFSETMSITL